MLYALRAGGREEKAMGSAVSPRWPGVGYFCFRTSAEGSQGAIRSSRLGTKAGSMNGEFSAASVRFTATEEKGDVSALLVRPEGAKWLLVLGHGASTDMRHRHLEAIAQALARAGVGTFRYNFPYAERRGGRDGQTVCVATVRAAVAAARDAADGMGLLAGGHSFGGRMTSLAAAEKPLEGVDGLTYFSFPLHTPGKPDTDRAAHLLDIDVPMLFLSGTRDTMANADLMRSVIDPLGDRYTLHWLDTADHGFKVLKRTRQPGEDVYDEAARVLSVWISDKL